MQRCTYSQRDEREITSKMTDSRSASSGEFARALGRAFAGAILFAFPLLMTMEMWWLGFYMDRDRLLLFLVFTLTLLFPLSYFVGFERTGGRFEDLLDAIVAFGVGAITSAAMLAFFGIITTAMPAGEIILILCDRVTLDRTTQNATFDFTQRSWGSMAQFAGDMLGDQMTVSQITLRDGSKVAANGACEIFHRNDGKISAISCLAKAGPRTIAANFIPSRL